jgi:hypothetical protein
MRAVALYNPEFEVYASIRQEALAFLDAHGLVPHTMYIAADGWVEAVYHLSNEDTAIVDVWHMLARMDGIEVMQPLLPIADGEGQSRVTVNFRLTHQVSSGLWQRLRRIVS